MANCSVNLTMNPDILSSTRKEEAFNEFYTEVRCKLQLSGYVIGNSKSVMSRVKCVEF